MERASLKLPLVDVILAVVTLVVAILVVVILVVAILAETTLSSCCCLCEHRFISGALHFEIFPQPMRELQNTKLVTPDLQSVDDRTLAAAVEAAATFVGISGELASHSHSVVTKLMTLADEFEEWQRLPSPPVYCPNTRSQYFYHSHMASNRMEQEHGHFHLFQGSDFVGMKWKSEKLGKSHLSCEAPAKNGKPSKNLTHILGLALRADGTVDSLFTTNHWVCGDNWLSGEDTVKLAEDFFIEDTGPLPEVDRWITKLLHFVRPILPSLYEARDIQVSEWKSLYGDEAFRRRELEIPSLTQISLTHYLQELSREATERYRESEGAL